MDQDEDRSNPENSSGDFLEESEENESTYEYAAHVLYLMTMFMKKSAVETAVENFLKRNQLDPSYRLNWVVDKYGQHKNHAYLWLKDLRGINILSEKNPDGSERSEEFYLDVSEETLDKSLEHSSSVEYSSGSTKETIHDPIPNESSDPNKSSEQLELSREINPNGKIYSKSMPPTTVSTPVVLSPSISNSPSNSDLSKPWYLMVEEEDEIRASSSLPSASSSGHLSNKKLVKQFLKPIDTLYIEMTKEEYEESKDHRSPNFYFDSSTNLYRNIIVCFLARINTTETQLYYSNGSRYNSLIVNRVPPEIPTEVFLEHFSEFASDTRKYSFTVGTDIFQQSFPFIQRKTFDSKNKGEKDEKKQEFDSLLITFQSNSLDVLDAYLMTHWSAFPNFENPKSPIILSFWISPGRDNLRPPKVGLINRSFSGGTRELDRPRRPSSRSHLSDREGFQRNRRGESEDPFLRSRGKQEKQGYPASSYSSYSSCSSNSSSGSESSYRRRDRRNQTRGGSFKSPGSDSFARGLEQETEGFQSVTSRSSRGPGSFRENRRTSRDDLETDFFHSSNPFSELSK